jgi:hypothetical protein
MYRFSFTSRLLYPRGRAAGTHWIGGGVDPRAGLDDLEKRKFLTLSGLELQPSVAQPVASRYPGYSTRVLESLKNCDLWSCRPLKIEPVSKKAMLPPS